MSSFWSWLSSPTLQWAANAAAVIALALSILNRWDLRWRRRFKTSGSLRASLSELQEIVEGATSNPSAVPNLYGYRVGAAIQALTAGIDAIPDWRMRRRAKELCRSLNQLRGMQSSEDTELQDPTALTREQRMLLQAAQGHVDWIVGRLHKTSRRGAA